MRTKTLVFSAVALAAGVLSAMAQSNVFSVNVVGYVNVPLAAGSPTLLSNPLDNGTNTLNDLVGALPTKSSAQLWNGNGFTASSKQASGWNPNLSVPPGTGFFVTASANSTNTFVGNVVVGPGGSVTNSLTTSVVLVGSMIPYADTLNGTNILLSVIPTKSSIQVWNGNGYTASSKQASGWNPNLSLGVAQGFFITPSAAVNWVQTLPAQ